MSDSTVYGVMPPVSVAPPAAAGYTLYDPGSVALATLLGSPVAGALLMAVNYNRLGRKTASTLTLILGVLASGVVVLLASVAPSAVSGSFGTACLVGIAALARKLQGPAVAQHTAGGGKLASKWAALGVGVAFLCVVFAAVAVPIYMGSSRTKVIIGTKDEVFYSGTATKQDAQALGNALKSIDYFQDKGTSVFLDKDAQGPTISLVQREGVWDEPEMLANSEEVAREVASSIGGLPVRVKLINSSEDVKKTGVIGLVMVGTKDKVYYEGTATQAEAQALGAALKSDGYFEDHGATVFASKDGRGTVLSFVVKDGIWDDAASVTAFEVIAKGVAPTVGGLPVTLRLVSTGLENKREVKLK